jgi:hypothetical protein
MNNDKENFSKLDIFLDVVVKILTIVILVLFFYQFIPAEFWTNGPATGGDTGSHFWPLYTLFHYGIPEGVMRVWNPANLAGEPHLIHYFPFPFIFMALLANFVPIGLAFNIGTMIPVLFLPITVFICIEKMHYGRYSAMTAAGFSVISLYNESYSMWGGNVFSTLAGQFAHIWAMCFFFLAVGFTAEEIRKKKQPFWSAIFWSTVMISHGYMILGIPLVFFSFCLFYPFEKSRLKFLHCSFSGLWAFLLSAWFLIPSILNTKWTTSFPIIWGTSNLLEEALPSVFYPVLVLGLVAVLFQIFLPQLKNHRKEGFIILAFWWAQILGFTVYYFVFPKVGLVDVRAIPEIQLFVCISFGTLVGFLLGNKQFIKHGRITAMTIFLICLFWADHCVSGLPSWMQWNYSGWQTKPLYTDLIKLTNSLRGSFSDSRVIYEHNDQNNATGTVRVFEMLGFWSERGTIESLYLQANILAPMCYYLQGVVSKTPSCPFIQYPCTSATLEERYHLLKLLGVGSLILMTDDLRNQARKVPELIEGKTFGPWQVFEFRQKPSLVEVLSKPVRWISNNDWKKQFYDWFINYKPGDLFLALDNQEISSAEKNLIRTSSAGYDECAPCLSVTFNKMKLSTNCPGKPHFLKMAYHPSWKTSSGDKLFIISPGFILFIPSRKEVVFTFGNDPCWQLSKWVSIIAFIGLFFQLLSKKN